MRMATALGQQGEVAQCLVMPWVEVNRTAQIGFCLSGCAGVFAQQPEHEIGFDTLRGNFQIGVVLGTGFVRLARIGQQTGLSQ